MAQSYSHLLSPGRIGSMMLRNRIFMTAMGTYMAETDGTVTDRQRAYYVERAKGGAALINMGSVSVSHPLGCTMEHQTAISDDRHIPGIKAVADEVHQYGAKLSLQIHSGGLVAMEDMLAGRPVWTPSIPVPKTGDMMDGFLEEELAMAPFGRIAKVDFQVLSAADIKRLVGMFAAGANRAKQAGVDGVEIHGGHGYIISSFLSPATNQRTDEYGGTIENRARLLTEVIKAVRTAVGPDFPVWCKLDSQEFALDEGISLEDAKKTARLAEAAGVDAITVSAYHDTNQGLFHSHSHTPEVPGYLVPNAAAIKAVVRVPVITVGRIEPEMADKYIGEGKLDFVAMGRKLLADPHLPRKLKEGRPDDILPCVYCYTCISQIYLCKSVKCAVNPETAFERERAIKPAETKKRVVVIGGGPAGMETARRLSLKGHNVTLLEQSDRLGGTAQFASIAYAPNERIVTWLKRQIAQSTVTVQLGAKATPDVVRSFNPAEVVVATGAVRTMPPIKGGDRSNVFSGDDMRRLVLGQDLGALRDKAGWPTRLALQAGGWVGVTKSAEAIRQASRVWMPLGKRIVIIGGELVGLELAEFLAHRGRAVTVIDDVAKFGAGLQIVRRWRVLSELRSLGVVMLPRARNIAIGDRVVTYVTTHDQTRAIAADHVIVAKGATGDTSLAETLRVAGFTVHTAGDCNGVGYIEGAMESAAELARII